MHVLKSLLSGNKPELGRERYTVCNLPVVTETGFNTPVISTGDFSFDTQPGFRLKAGTFLSADVAVEAGYFQQDTWHSRATATSIQLNGFNGNPFSLALDADRDNLAFIGEINLDLTYPLSRWLSARGGYNVIWVEGLALAADQIGLAAPGSTTSLDADGGVFLYGAHVGLEAVW